ncbi:MAG: M23 family metallopeptidase, partial [Synechococcaceae cyanobacterium SM2_3_60]|nr:M23 family metallopeptidase [Synechococcaceae cyanobacterium SM2_3_60]
NPGQDIVVALPNERVESSADETLLYPLPAVFPVTSGFGMRVHPISGLASFHQGIDLGAPTGTPILAAYSGQVIASGHAGGYGKAVVLAHDDSRRTRYAHMSEIQVSEGDWVSQGDVIGLVGSTGNSTGPHLHFEFWQRNEQSEWIALDISERLQLAIAQR